MQSVARQKEGLVFLRRKDGFARFVHYGESMSDIPENQELLELLVEINQEADSG